MTESLATRSPVDQAPRKDVLQPSPVHNLLGEAIKLSQRHQIYHYLNSNEALGKAFIGHDVGRLSNGTSLYVGQRYIPGEGVVYGLLDTESKTGKRKERLGEDEHVYRTSEEVAELLGDEATSHAARILWRLARDKNALPEDIVKQASALNLVSIVPRGKDKSAVVFLPDPQTGKMIRVFTEHPMPEDEQQRAILIRDVQEWIAESTIQNYIHRKGKLDSAFDLTRERGKVSIRREGLVGKKTELDEWTDPETKTIINYGYVHPDEAHRVDREQAAANPTPVLLPGWSMGGNTKSAEGYGQALANKFGRPGLIIDTMAEHITNESLYTESVALANFIQKKGLKKISLIGHSQGGRKAIFTALILQERRKERTRLLDEGVNPEALPEELRDIPEVAGVQGVNIRGLVGQTRGELIRKFGWDALGKTVARVGLQQPRRVSQAGIDIGMGVVRKISRFGVKDYIKRFPNEVDEMASVSEEYLELLSSVDVPVGLIFGRNDKVSDIAAVTQASLGYEGMPEEELSKAIGEAFFPNAPRVEVKIVDDAGGLHGVPIFASDAVADVSYQMANPS